MRGNADGCRLICTTADGMIRQPHIRRLPFYVPGCAGAGYRENTGTHGRQGEVPKSGRGLQIHLRVEREM
ncbi:hypothetical protein DW690_23870 [Dorea longicatena]|nr:hypothetical protein DW690_23870 [Dorea longicatena]